MNLVLDFGNTRIKAGVFKGDNLVENLIFNSENELLEGLIPFEPTITRCLIGSVTLEHESLIDALSQKFDTQVFTKTMPTPLTNLYKSAITLGSDRLAAAVGAYTFFPDRPVLTIDAGTCIKYNFVNAQNEYLGGAISPGLPMRLKAMHEYTHALPLVETDKSYAKLIGQNTAESLLGGALLGAACEVDDMISRYEKEYAGLQAVITGGDADYLCKQLKNRFFANPNILLVGLNTILNLNSEK